MKLSWNEPKWSYEPRWKEKAISQIKATSWLRVSFWLFIFLPLSIIVIQHFYPNPRFRWYYLPIVFVVCGLFMAYQGLITYKMNRPKITVDDEGISLQGPEDNSFKKYNYDKITSIELVSDGHSNYSLSWHYEGKNIIRGLSQEVDITKLKTITENNSNLKLEMRQP
jgi:hypothetical protein